jgi:hypothetical protein
MRQSSMYWAVLLLLTCCQVLSPAAAKCPLAHLASFGEPDEAQWAGKALLAKDLPKVRYSRVGVPTYMRCFWHASAQFMGACEQVLQ